MTTNNATKNTNGTVEVSPRLSMKERVRSTLGRQTADQAVPPACPKCLRRAEQARREQAARTAAAARRRAAAQEQRQESDDRGRGRHQQGPHTTQARLDDQFSHFGNTAGQPLLDRADPPLYQV
jgi:hypothetical protein